MSAVVLRACPAGYITSPESWVLPARSVIWMEVGILRIVLGAAVTERHLFHESPRQRVHDGVHREVMGHEHEFFPSGSSAYGRAVRSVGVARVPQLERLAQHGADEVEHGVIGGL